MDFTIDPLVDELRGRVRDFVQTHVMPLEHDPGAYDEVENIAEGPLRTLRDKARAEGLWCLQLPERLGGRGLDKRGMAVCYEEMNRSIFGPVVFNCAAPDDGNMMLLAKAGTEAQQERLELALTGYLVPEMELNLIHAIERQRSDD